jgi:hypothetical protein
LSRPQDCSRDATISGSAGNPQEHAGQSPQRASPQAWQRPQPSQYATRHRGQAISQSCWRVARRLPQRGQTPQPGHTGWAEAWTDSQPGHLTRAMHPPFIEGTCRTSPSLAPRKIKVAPSSTPPQAKFAPEPPHAQPLRAGTPASRPHARTGRRSCSSASRANSTVCTASSLDKRIETIRPLLAPANLTLLDPSGASGNLADVEYLCGLVEPGGGPRHASRSARPTRS